MTELQALHDSVVLEEEIDSLGHMNVRFYVQRADSANRALLKASGIMPADGQRFRRIDTFNRFHREQFAGAKLQTLAGFIAREGASDTSVDTYVEIRNTDNGDLAASFVFSTGIIDINSQQLVSLPDLSGITPIEPPDYGKPRSLSLKEPSKVDLATLESVVPDEPTPGMMSGRRENTVHQDDCDEKGRLREDVDLMFVIHRPDPENEEEQAMGPPLLRDEQGRRYSFAMMETRSVVWQRPNAGDRIVSIGADIAYGDKWRQSRRWMFVKDSGVLLGVSDSVGVCIDLDARKAISLPADVQATLEKNCLPQFA